MKRTVRFGSLALGGLLGLSTALHAQQLHPIDGSPFRFPVSPSWVRYSSESVFLSPDEKHLFVGIAQIDFTSIILMVSRGRPIDRGESLTRRAPKEH